MIVRNSKIFRSVTPLLKGRNSLFFNISTPPPRKFDPFAGCSLTLSVIFSSALHGSSYATLGMSH
ncbi:MAG: hypothetical protein LBG28_10315, partial [Tannerella sp.]|nr:hypothetical protein [Tannerella sp.]